MKNSVQWDTEVMECLKELGLTEYDAKVYYTLVATSPMTAIDIVREVGMPMSKIYVVLGRLETGGWISVTPERPKLYRAVDPGVIVDNACNQAICRLEKSRSLLMKSLKEMYDRRAGDVETSEFHVVHGTANVMSQIKEIIRSQKGGITVFISFVNKRTVERINDLIKEYDGPKQLYVASDKQGLGQFAWLFEHVPYARSMEARQQAQEGIVFLYTDSVGVYGTVEDDDFKMALIIRNPMFLGMIRAFAEGHHKISLEPGSFDVRVN